MLEVKEKIISYCNTSLPKEDTGNTLEQIFLVSGLISCCALVTFFKGLNQNLLSYLVNNLAITFSILTFFSITMLSLKEFKKTVNSFCPEKQIETTDLLIQTINNSKIFKLFPPQELKSIIVFIDKKHLILKDLLIIKEKLKKVISVLEKETRQKQEDEKTKQILLNYTRDSKHTQNLISHLSLCTDAAPTTSIVETKEKKLYSHK